MLTHSIPTTFYRKISQNDIHLHFYPFQLAPEIALVKKMKFLEIKLFCAKPDRPETFQSLFFLSGYQYAMFTMKVMLSTILRNYKFNTKLAMRDLRPKFEVTLRLTNKHMVGVERRVW